MDTKIIFLGLHPIDRDQESTKQIDFTGKESSVKAYVSDLIERLLSEANSRSFRFRSQTTEVRSRIARIANNGDYDKAPQTIAERLLAVEKRTQTKLDRFARLQKGTLVQAAFEKETKQYLLLTKIDHHDFLDERDLTRRIGLPYQKRVLKACIAPVAADGSFEKVSVFDSNGKIAEYWWKDFLELEEERSDERNTETAFYALDQLLASEVKRRSKADYIYLRNDLISYFRTRPELNYSELLDHLFGNFRPSVNSIDVTQLRSKASSLPGSKKFDQQFNIKSGVVTARYKNVVPLRDNLDLLLKADVQDISTVITPVNHRGVKGILIRTETGYEYFNRKH